MSILSFRQRGEWLVAGFNVSHLIDAHTVQRASGELNAALARLPLRGNVVVSFEGVDNVSTQAAGLLREAKTIVDDRFGRLVLCRVGQRLSELMALTGLSSAFEVYPRLRDLLAESKSASGVFASVGGPRSRGDGGAEMNWID